MYKRYLLLSLLAMSVSTLISCTDQQDDKARFTALTSSKHAMINGKSDTTTAHQAVVAIGSDDYGVFCTGTLVHSQYVVTAAHCVTTEDFRGKIVLDAPEWIGVGNNEDNLKKYKVKNTYYHSSYGERELNEIYGTIDADIAILKLKTAVPESVAKPIPIQPKSLGVGTKDLPVTMEFVGFGYNESATFGKKLKFSSHVTKYCGAANEGDSKTGCEEGSVKLGMGSGTTSYEASYFCNELTKGALCHPASSDYPDDYYCYCGYDEYILLPYGGLYYEQEEGGPCQGDSGGPAFITIDGKEYLAGVTSYGDGACGAYGVSTAIQDYNDWLIEKAPELAESKPSDPEKPVTAEICDDKIDNDGDGKIDCDDPDCAKDASCQKPSESVASSVVISQIYPGGGLSDSVYSSKYVELFNRGTKPETLEGWSIQYGAAASDNVSSMCVIEKAVIPAGGYYLIEVLGANGNSAPPESDMVCTSGNWAQKQGRLILVASDTKLDSSKPATSAYVDAVGYGGSSWYEGSGAAPELSKTTAAMRKNGGCTDTNDNAKDFESVAPSPRNSKTAIHVCGSSDPVDPVDPVEPTDPVAPVDPVEPTDPVDPVDPVEPTDPVDPVDPVEPTDPVDPVDPVEPTDPVEPDVPLPGEICDDHIDNDGDGQIDCDDSDCSVTSACSKKSKSSGSSCSATPMTRKGSPLTLLGLLAIGGGLFGLRRRATRARG